jgi:hypothetical protein
MRRSTAWLRSRSTVGAPGRSAGGIGLFFTTPVALVEVVAGRTDASRSPRQSLGYLYSDRGLLGTAGLVSFGLACRFSSSQHGGR